MVLAPRLAEHPDVLLPVLVCQDGFTITHSAEPVALLAGRRGARVRRRLRDPLSAARPRAQPTTQGPFAMPDYYFELRRQQIAALEAALDALAEVAPSSSSSRAAGTARRALPARRRRARARRLGSTAGTIKDVVDELREEGEPVGLLKIVSFRPFPAARDRRALARRRRR